MRHAPSSPREENFRGEEMRVIYPVQRIGLHITHPARALPILDAPLAEQLAHEQRRGSLFDRVLLAERLALSKRLAAAERAEFRLPLQGTSPHSVDGSPPPPATWQPWPAHPPLADESRRWWPGDDFPPETPEIVIEDRRPDRPPNIVLMPMRGGLFDIWI